MGESHESHASPQELESAWGTYHEAIGELRATLHAMPIVRTPFDHAAADRWLLQSQAAAHNLVLAPDPRHPRFLLHNVFEPTIYSWLLPNPDFLYRYAFLDGSGTYRIEGVRRSAHFVDAQMISGFWGDADMKLMESYDFEALGIPRDGAVDIHVGPVKPKEDRPWIRTEPSRRNTMILREAFYEWGAEERSSLRIASVSRDRLDRRAPDEHETARRIDAAVRMVRFCHETFSGGLTADVVEKVGYNRFLLLDTSRDEDAANPVAGYVPVVFDIAPDEALVLEFELPDAAYWGLQLGDIWWQAADYVDHQSSLNGRQIEVDEDGRVRVVVCREDPGVANWLETTGLERGIVLLRWYRADRHPVPKATRIQAAEVDRALPSGTPRIDPRERRRRLITRRERILLRYDD